LALLLSDIGPYFVHLNALARKLPHSFGHELCAARSYLDPETQDEQGLAGESRPGIDYFANTSVMEYQIERFGETIGLGTYDQHVMKALYGRVLEVMDDDGHGGIAPTAQASFAPRLETHRRALVRGDRSFTAILTAEGWFADLAPLAYLSHFVTPPASPIRFSARFFLCPVPPGQGPRLIAEEASEGFWVDPAEAHRRFQDGEWPMAEPAEYGTQYLAQFESYDAVWRHHADRQPKFNGIIDRLDAARYYLFDWSTVVRPA
jgi:hypothetical protein